MMIAVIVVILTLLVGGLVWWLIGRSHHDSSESGLVTTPSDQWENGIDELWNLEIDAGEEDFLYTSDEYMVLIDISPIYYDGGDSDGTASFTSWRIDGEKPEQLANATIDYSSMQDYAIVGTHLVASGTDYDTNEGQIYDIATGQKEEVPWGEGDSVTIAGASLVIACGSGSNCAGYDADLNQVWKEHLEPEVAAYITVNGDIIQSDGHLKGISCYDGRCKIVDLSTGKVTDSEFEPPDQSPYPTNYYSFGFRDGWTIQYVGDGGQYGMAYVNHDGKLIDEASSGEITNVPTKFQISNGGITTVEDMNEMQSGDVKPSDGLTVLTGTGTDCEETAINDEATVEDTFSMWSSSGDQCEIVASPLMSSSGQGKVLAIGPDYRSGIDADILALLATERGEYVWKSELAGQYIPSTTSPGSLAKLSFGRLVSPNRLLTIDVNINTSGSQVTAYQPK